MEDVPVPTHPSSILPLFSRRDVGVEMKSQAHPTHVHLCHVLWMGCCDGLGVPCSSMPCSSGGHQDGEWSHSHPTPSFLNSSGGCWDGDGVPCPPIPCSSTPGSPGGMLGWRGGLTPSTPAPFMCDPAEPQGPTSLGQGAGMGLGPTSPGQAGGMETGSSICLGKPNPRQGHP